MALFTDGTIADVDDLLAYDSGILRVSSAEGVDLAAKLRLANEEVGVGLEEFLVRRVGRSSSPGSPSQLTLYNVVVTPPLKQWHALWTLALVYDDVGGNHVNSRYAVKYKECRQRALWASESLYRIGVGLVSAPIPRAGAPVVRPIAGSLPAATYEVQIAWRNASGERGTPSDPVIQPLNNDGLIGVRAGNPPTSVAGFDVYVGDSPGSASRQNVDVVAPDAEWIMSDAGLVEGAGLPAGQTPDFYLHNDRILQRG